MKRYGESKYSKVRQGSCAFENLLFVNSIGCHAFLNSPFKFYSYEYCDKYYFEFHFKFLSLDFYSYDFPIKIKSHNGRSSNIP